MINNPTNIKRIITSCLNLLNMKENTIYDVERSGPSLGQAQHLVGLNRLLGVPALSITRIKFTYKYNSGNKVVQLGWINVRKCMVPNVEEDLMNNVGII